MTTLHTQRLVLSRPTNSDAESIALHINHESITKFLLNVPYPYTLSDAQDYVARCQKQWKENTTHAFCIRKESAQSPAIGICSLVLDTPNKRGMLGYWLSLDFQRQGYMSEAIEKLIEYGFGTLDLQRIWANHMAINQGSSKIMQRLGMQIEGTLRSHYRYKGQAYDMVYRGILREEWETHR